MKNKINNSINDQDNWYEWINHFFEYSLCEEDEIIFDKKYDDDILFAKEVEKRRYFENIIDQLEFQNFDDDDEEDDENNEVEKPKSILISKSFFQKNKKIILATAASIMLCVSVGIIYYLNQNNKDKSVVKNIKLNTNKNTEKSPLNTKNETEKSLVVNDSLENIIPKKEELKVIEKQKLDYLASIDENLRKEIKGESGQRGENKKFQLYEPKNEIIVKDSIRFKWKGTLEKEILIVEIVNKFDKFITQISLKNNENIYLGNLEEGFFAFKIRDKNEKKLYTGYFIVEKK